MKKNLFAFSLFVLLILSSRIGGAAMPVEHIKSKFSLPSSEWAWDKEVSGDKDSLFGMIVEKLQGAVNFRVNYYQVESTAASFLEDVRKQLMLKTEYHGARFEPVTTQEINGKSWSTFQLIRKDKIYQELWTRKGENVILFMFYTAAGQNYYDRYRPDIMTLMRQASTF